MWGRGPAQRKQIIKKKKKKYLLLKIKYIFLRDSYVCTRWIFIFDSDQAQINSAELCRVFCVSGP
jgi:hypothetical protein